MLRGRMKLIDVGAAGPAPAKLPRQRAARSGTGQTSGARRQLETISTLRMSAHAGTHVDAPRHFFDDAGGIEALPLDLLCGRARVVDVAATEAITADDLRQVNLSDDVRLLIKTSNSQLWGDAAFHKEYIGVGESAARYLVETRHQARRRRLPVGGAVQDARRADASYSAGSRHDCDRRTEPARRRAWRLRDVLSSAAGWSARTARPRASCCGNIEARGTMSALLDDTLVIVLAGGAGERLFPLTRDRAKPAVYFGGPYRIIDFSLSNCINSGLRRVFIASQYKSLSLNRHIRMGWSIVSEELGEFIERSCRLRSAWASSGIRARPTRSHQNLYSITRENPRFVIVLAGDHVYKMDYARMLRFHRDNKAALTLAAIGSCRSRTHTGSASWWWTNQNG